MKEIPLDSSMLQVKHLGEQAFDSPVFNHERIGEGLDHSFFNDAKDRVKLDIYEQPKGEYDDLSLEAAGASKKVFFNPAKTKVAIITCGGLSPGLNDIIRGLVLDLHYWYDVKDIIGIRYGYSGLSPDTDFPPIQLTPDVVDGIHLKGGTILGSSRGNPGTPVLVDSLVKLGVDILFCVGGDGTLRGAHDLATEIARQQLAISIIGIPKTIDNDISFVYRTFGFRTAVEKARDVLECAHVEAKGAKNGIGLVKLMGREAGFITARASVASGEANYCLIPEMEFPLYGEGGFLQHLRERLKIRHHAVIALSEGAGRHLIGDSGKRDASGNVIFNDIGLFMKDEIKKAFAEWGEPVSVKYFDPSYIIRSVSANSEDNVFCANLARYAAAAGMAGKTDMMIGYWHGVFVNVPLMALEGRKKRMKRNQHSWLGVIASTGQPLEWWQAHD